MFPSDTFVAFSLHRASVSLPYPALSQSSLFFRLVVVFFRCPPTTLGPHPFRHFFKPSNLTTSSSLSLSLSLSPSLSFSLSLSLSLSLFLSLSLSLSFEKALLVQSPKNLSCLLATRIGPSWVSLYLLKGSMWKQRNSMCSYEPKRTTPSVHVHLE